MKNKLAAEELSWPVSESTPGAAFAPAADCLAREAELHEIAETGGGEYLWVWEAAKCAVVMGRAPKCIFDVHHEACARAGVPVLRRQSGGGTVLLSKGCLNYTLILRCNGESVQESYRRILDAVIRAAGAPGARRESTDLTVRNRKFGGCAQRRRRHTLLHHGTLLYDFDIEAAMRFLTEPARQPAYRQGRPHTEFLTNVDLHPDFTHRLAERFPGVVVS